MIYNYLKTAWRNLLRNKSYMLINVLGLTVGIAACLLIFMVVRFETSFDNFHPKRNNVYRVVSEFETEDGVSHSPGAPFPVIPALRIDFPQMKQVAGIMQSINDQVTIPTDDATPQKKFLESFYFAEPQFFSLFNFPWLAGDPKTSLTDPGNVVITRKLAEKYFTDWKSAMGKTIIRNNKEVYKISGILENVPANTDFPLTHVASYSSIKNTNVARNLNDWISTFSGSYAFVEMPDNYSVEQFNKDLRNFVKKHKPVEYQKDKLIAQPLTAIHFDDEFGTYGGHTFSKSLITALILIGIFLLVIACVNFINLATAQAVNRAKEVGVRKVLGSNRQQLAFQFLSETGLITFIALLIAIIVAMVTLPFLNKLLETSMTFSFVKEPALIVFLLATGLVVTLLSGLYPAFVISGYNPINALKSKVAARSGSGITLRRGLVILQFTIAHILIIGMIIVVSQMRFFKNATLGFDKASIINVPLPNDSISKLAFTPLHNQLKQNPNILHASFSFASPSADGNWQSDFRYDHSAKNLNWTANLKWADTGYFATYNLKFVAGRPYYHSDTVREFVINETLMRKLGVRDPQQAIGKELNFWDGSMVGPIVGVVRDFNSYSLREPMAPVVLGTFRDVYQTINIKIKPGKDKETLAFVEQHWNKAFPDYVYEHRFLDETIAGFYRQENQLSILYRIFAGIAIFISCLGLYGLVSFMAAQRTREVGIRKVLGASIGNIVYL
ncbi:MAG TPA: ABC transporter permease, partial [Chitinophagaceae bacterium]